MFELITEWIPAHLPNTDLIYREGLGDQIEFVRSNISNILARSYEEFTELHDRLKVIGEHESKSVTLPVYLIEWNDCEFVLRYNFHDWKVSVNSPRYLVIDFKNLFDQYHAIIDMNCEGFPADRVYGSYEDNPREFTVEIQDNFDLYVFFWLIRHD